MRHWRTSTLFIIAGTMIFVERAALINTLSAGKLALACAVLGGSVGLVLGSRGWLDLGDRPRSIATSTAFGALIAIAIGIAANGSRVDWGPSEPFVVEAKWRSYILKFGGKPWHMLRVRISGFGAESVSVPKDTWERTREGQTIILEIGKGGLGFDMVRLPATEIPR